jgi:hypothetical protein
MRLRSAKYPNPKAVDSSTRRLLEASNTLPAVGVGPDGILNGILDWKSGASPRTLWLLG